MKPNLALVFVLLLVVALTTAACASDGGDGDSENEQSPTVGDPAPTLVSRGTTEEPVSSLIGERLEVVEDVDIFVEAFERTTNGDALVDDFLSLEVESGEEIIAVTVRVINDTDIPDGSRASDFSLWSRGVQIAAGFDALFGLKDDLDADVLPPGAESTGLIAWSVIQGFDQLVLEYTPQDSGRSFLVGLEGSFTTDKPTITSEDESRLNELVREFYKAFAEEDYEGLYEFVPDSMRGGCSKSEFVIGFGLSVEFAKGLMGDDGWDAFKSDLSNPGDEFSIEAVPGGALVYTDVDKEGYEVYRVDGDWVLFAASGEDPCDFSFD